MLRSCSASWWFCRTWFLPKTVKGRYEQNRTVQRLPAGGTAGDALGSPVKALEWPDIEIKFGSQGIIDFASAYGITGAISDATEMMLFTA